MLGISILASMLLYRKQFNCAPFGCPMHWLLQDTNPHARCKQLFVSPNYLELLLLKPSTRRKSEQCLVLGLAQVALSHFLKRSTTKRQIADTFFHLQRQYTMAIVDVRHDDWSRHASDQVVLVANSMISRLCLLAFDKTGRLTKTCANHPLGRLLAIQWSPTAAFSSP